MMCVVGAADCGNLGYMANFLQDFRAWPPPPRPKVCEPLNLLVIAQEEYSH